jgi:hypothetical protein
MDFTVLDFLYPFSDPENPHNHKENGRSLYVAQTIRSTSYTINERRRKEEVQNPESNL